MPGLVPGIHVFKTARGARDVDGRNHPGMTLEAFRLMTQILTYLRSASLT